MSAAAENMVGDRPSLVKKFANKYSIDPKVLMATLKATCFRVPEGEVSDEQMVALLVVADQYSLNPFTKEIYAFPDKHKGIIPVVSVDGWVRIVNEHPDYNGYDVILPAEQLPAIPGERPPAWEWVTILMHRKRVEHTPPLTEYLDECYKPPLKKTGSNGPYQVNGPWQTHPKRFLRHKAFIQAGRIVFGFAGIYDEDEAQRILEASVVSSQGTAIVGANRTEQAKAALADKRGERNPLATVSAAKEAVGTSVAQEQRTESDKKTRESEWEKPAGPAHKFDVASACALLRMPGLDSTQLKANFRAIADDYEFSERELPIDVEAIYRDLLEAAVEREAKQS